MARVLYFVPSDHDASTIVSTFDKPLNAATVTVTEGTATSAAPTFSGNDVVIGLTGVTNQQYVTIALTEVASADGGIGGWRHRWMVASVARVRCASDSSPAT